MRIWDKVFKNGPSKIYGRQPLKIFTWSNLEYFAPFDRNISHEQKVEWYHQYSSQTQCHRQE